MLAAATVAGAESIAVMPCCYAHAAAAEAAPRALRMAAGVAVAADVQRTYTLEAAGYDVGWKHIPAAVTPMNRVLVARRRRRAQGQRRTTTTFEQRLVDGGYERCERSLNQPPSQPGAGFQNPI